MKYAVILLISLLTLVAQGQDLRIQLGSNTIGENQAFTISIVSKNGNIKSYDKFPDIKGFRKLGTSSSSQTNIVNGRVSSTHSIIMNYSASAKGTYTLPPFEINANGFLIKSPGTTITVKEAVQQHNNYSDPFDNFFGRRRSAPAEFVDIKEDAFFALSTDKKMVYVGEGFTTTLAFYVAEANRAPLQFYDLGRQLGEILKVVKPASCWEENFSIEQINGQRVTINGKNYTQYKVYQGAFYPLNNEDIVFPSVGLDMIKYKVAKNPSFFGQNRQESLKKFRTKTVVVKVKELPPHPFKDKVAVGNFKLREKIDKTELNTGESFNYDFNIYGEGNVAGITAPIIEEAENLELYPPNTSQQINRSGNRVTGTKAFNYYGIPKEPGTYNLSDHFEWIFFNLRKDDYDTLKSNVVLTVTGESRKNESIISNDLGSFYDLIEVESNEFMYQNDWPILRIAMNVFILLVIGISVFLMYKMRG